MNRNLKIECPEYLDFIRSKSCLVCMTPPPSDPDHLKARGLGSGKRNDFTCIPLCRQHHSERGQIGDEKFEHKHVINLWHEAVMYLTEFLVDDASRREIYIKRGKS